MYRLYKKDRYFFIKYNLATIILLGTATVLLYHYFSSLPALDNNWLLFLAILPLALPNLWTIVFSAAAVFVVAVLQTYFVFLPSDLLLVVLGVVIGLQSAWLMHNAAHDSIKPAWLNRLVGELTGLQQLMGFPSWAVSHILHHQFPDDPEKDPHPPVFLSFKEFLDRMGPLMARSAHKTFRELWGDSQQTQRIWKLMIISSMACRYLRAAVLLVLLGVKLFVLCFLVSKVVNLLWYVHFNYYTHQPNDNGEIEVLNLNHNFYYKLMNATMAGVYYHRNHHRKASLFDPRTLDKEQQDKPLIYYRY